MLQPLATRSAGTWAVSTRHFRKRCLYRLHLSRAEEFAQFEGGVGTSEEIGLRLMRDLAIPDGSDALANLRSKSPEEIVDVLHRDSTVNFLAGGTIDGWVLTETKGRRDLLQR